MDPLIESELRQLRIKINRIPFTNKLKSVYTLDYVDIITEIKRDETSTTINKINTLNYLIDNNL